MSRHPDRRRLHALAGVSAEDIVPEITEGTVLWEPSAERRVRSHTANYMRWLAEKKGSFDSYQALWQWSRHVFPATGNFSGGAD